ncbi:EI24 domain-containing protein [Aurantiacibacter poecillastricola]|uniref:EI24 domain-containing protein n=1 Tax=Aurantiacibacter poecillastricola TaxID=3064385 RepID=UPI00273DDBC0|nr:EI24 domain-containing protein [Aurantiacibacter sp. 219JJ12-13]MDP5260558.1 EI24 domain-containing protein [Aurantiacibacter sp. 219JJ12-13]
MGALVTSLGLGLRQLLDGAVLRILLKSLAVSIGVFIIAATGGWFALDALLAWGGLEDTLFTGAGAVRGALSVLLALIGLWLVWRIVAIAVIQFFAEDIVQVIEARHYPQEAGQARELPFAEQARNALAAATRALLVNIVALPIAILLWVTGVGTFALLLVVNAVLLSRELQDMIWLRHRHEERYRSPLNGRQRFVLGGVIAAMMAVPFLAFLAPVTGAASATHLVHRTARQKDNA